MKLALITIDYEAQWGMPGDLGSYDVESTTRRLLRVLARHGVSAVFFVVGCLAEEHPALIEEIAAAGHEIALHGWRHENLARLGDGGLLAVEGGLARSEDLIERITGRRPAGFRAPYLLWLDFYCRDVYTMLATHGYRWVSNHKVHYPEELLRSERRLAPADRLLRRRPALLTGRTSRLLVSALNRRHRHRLGTGRKQAPIAGSDATPFWRDGLLEILIHCPVDTELLGLPAPQVSTSDEFLDYARFATRLALRRTGTLPVYTFHDWLIGSENCVAILEDLLTFLAAGGYKASTMSAAWERLVPNARPFRDGIDERSERSTAVDQMLGNGDERASASVPHERDH